MARTRKQPKSLDEILTQGTGMDAAERAEWRECIKQLSESGQKDEMVKVFQSFSYWRENYKNKK